MSILRLITGIPSILVFLTCVLMLVAPSTFFELTGDTISRTPTQNILMWVFSMIWLSGLLFGTFAYIWLVRQYGVSLFIWTIANGMLLTTTLYLIPEQNRENLSTNGFVGILLLIGLPVCYSIAGMIHLVGVKVSDLRGA